MPLMMYSDTFQSTLPVGGATVYGEIMGRINAFQSTLPVGGATPLFFSIKEK